MTGWYRRFIQNYAQTAEPLHKCLRKDRTKKFELSEEAVKAFEVLKTSMATAPVLVTLVDTVVSMQIDNRFFAKTKVDGEEILALLDTGASANCIGRGANAFLKDRTWPLRKLSEECVRTASGGETQVTGAITLPVEWEGETKDLEFLIMPGLTQRFNFGINIWDTFGLTFLGKGGREVAAVETTPDFDLMIGDLGNTLKPETACTPHQLTPEQHSTTRSRQRKDTRGRYEDGQGCRDPHTRWCAIGVAKEQTSTGSILRKRILPDQIPRCHLQVLQESRDGGRC